MRARALAWICLASVALSGVLYIGAALAAPAAANAGVCDDTPLGIVGPACDVGEGAVSVGQDVIEEGPGGAAQGIAEDVAGAAGEGVLELIRDAIVGAAVWFLEQIAALVDSTTDVELGSISTCIDPSGSVNSTLHGGKASEGEDCFKPVKWFGRQYAAMWGMATLFALALLLAVVFDAVARGDLETLWKAALIRLPLAFIFTAGAIAVTGMLLELTDAMSAGITKAVSKDAGDFFGAIVEGSQGAGGAAGGASGGPTGALVGAAEVPVFVGIVGALVMVVGALFVWLELIVRAASIYIVVFFLPFAFMAMIWPRTQGVLKRSLELLGVLIFSKFVIVAILALSAAALGNASDGAGFAQVLAGGAMLLLAAFSPFVLFKLVPFAEAGVAGAYNRRTAGGATLAAGMGGGALMMRQMAAANWRGGRPGGRGSGAGQSAGNGSAPSATPGADTASRSATPASAGAGGAAVGGVQAVARSGPEAADRLARTATAQVADHSGPPVAPGRSERPGAASRSEDDAGGPPVSPGASEPVAPPPAPDEERPRPPRSRIDRGEGG